MSDRLLKQVVQALRQKGNTMGIKRAQLHATARTISSFINETIKLDSDAPYQRGYVWGIERKRGLIESILDGTPIPSIILNDRAKAGFKGKDYLNVRNWSYGVIDGKQRIDAIRSFIEDQFTVPAEWFDRVEILEKARGKEFVLYSELSLASRMAFLQRSIPVAESVVPSLKEEERIFNRINYGGLRQGDSDLQP